MSNKKNIHMGRLSWQIPLIGFLLTFAIGFLLSFSNMDIRSDVQSIGLAMFSALASLGLYYTAKGFRCFKRYQTNAFLQNAVAGLAFNLFLVFIVATSFSAISDGVTTFGKSINLS